MLNLSFDRAARSHTERLALINAIKGAPPTEPETDWVEWKSQIDLTTPEWRFKCAKSVLGFGNRDPSFAAQHFDGCAYLVVGVEPGGLTGTTAHDPADVERWLGRYVASGEPQWRVDYMEADGRTVMLISVEAPRAGHPPFTLRKAYGTFEEGAIFVRRNGLTERANSHDVARLTQRASAGGARLDIALERFGDDDLRAFTYEGDAVDAFVSRETERLERWDSGGATFAVVGLRETRDAEYYDAEVDRYIETLPMRITYEAAKFAVERRMAELRLGIVNPSPANFASTQVTLRVPMEDAPVFFDADELHDALDDMKVPRAWGYGLPSFMPRISPPVIVAPTPDGSDIRREKDAMVVTFPPVDVRPRTSHPLKPVYLVLGPPYAGTAIEVEWRATSTGADGDASGRLTANVAAHAVDLTEYLLSDTEEVAG